MGAVAFGLRAVGTPLDTGRLSVIRAFVVILAAVELSLLAAGGAGNSDQGSLEGKPQRPKGHRLESCPKSWPKARHDDTWQ